LLAELTAGIVHLTAETLEELVEVEFAITFTLGVVVVEESLGLSFGEANLELLHGENELIDGKGTGAITVNDLEVTAETEDPPARTFGDDGDELIVDFLKRLKG
jgi:hypothetical protein